MSLETPEDKVRKLQETLLAKAKGEPGYRFYLLYDKIYRADVLAYAHERCRGTAAEALQTTGLMMTQLGLTINDRKTRICRVPGETFRFLGYTIGTLWSPKTGESYTGLRPSPQAVQKLCRAISDRTSRQWLHLTPEEMVKGLELRLTGWVNYFQLG